MPGMQDLADHNALTATSAQHTPGPAMKHEAFYRGYDAKVAEISRTGWTAARDEFNRVHPPGQKWTGSAAGLAYAHGEFQALSDHMGYRLVAGELEACGDGCKGCDFCRRNQDDAPADRAKATGSA